MTRPVRGSWGPTEGPVGEAVARFVAEVAGPGLEYRSSCIRRTTTLHRFARSQPGSDDVVVKVFSERSTAQAAFDASRRLADLLAPRPGGESLTVTAPVPLAMAEDAPAFALPWIEGISMRHAIAHHPDQLPQLLYRAGVGLAIIHERSTAQAWDPVKRTLAARTLRLRPSPGDAQGPSLLPRYADFHPHNVLLTGATLTVIDPPAGDEITYVHHDMVNFLYKAHKCLLAGPMSVRRTRDAVNLVDPVMAFFRGYFATTSRTMTLDDAAIIDGYLRGYLRTSHREQRRRKDLAELGLFGPLLRRQVRRAFGLIVGDPGPTWRH